MYNDGKNCNTSKSPDATMKTSCACGTRTTGKVVRATPLMLVTLAIALSGAGFFAIYLVVHEERKDFQESVKIGMSKDEIVDLRGAPDKVIQPGGCLEEFGNAKRRVVKKETWVYHVFPKSMFRFVLTFDGKKVTTVELELN